MKAGQQLDVFILQHDVLAFPHMPMIIQQIIKIDAENFRHPEQGIDIRLRGIVRLTRVSLSSRSSLPYFVYESYRKTT